MLRRPGEIAIAVTSLVGVCALALAIVRRVVYPWPLEWMEGVVLEHVLAIAEGRTLYGPPRAELVPLLYPPVSYGVLAGFVTVFGKSLAAARLGSVCATVGIMGFTAATAARLAPGQGRWAALLAIGLVALGHGYGGTFYDLCRVDAVALCLLAGGVWLVGEDRRRARVVAGFVVLAVATLAKQQAAAVLGALALLSLKRPRLQSGAVAGIAALVVLIAIGQWWTGGWLWTYCVSVPRGHAIHWSLLPVAVLADLLLPLPLLCLAWVVGLVRARRDLDPAHAALLGGIGAALLSRAHEGAFDNVLLTGFVLGAPVAAAVLTRVSCEPTVGLRWRAIVAVALLAQAAILVTPPAAITPRAADAAAWRGAARALRRCAGGKGSIALDHPSLGTLPFAHTMAISDVLAGGRYGLRGQAEQVVVRGLGRRDIGAVAIGDATFPALDEALAAHFVPCTMRPALPLAVGHDPGPVLILRRKPEVEEPLAGAGASVVHTRR